MAIGWDSFTVFEPTETFAGSAGSVWEAETSNIEGSLTKWTTQREGGYTRGHAVVYRTS